MAGKDMAGRSIRTNSSNLNHDHASSWSLALGTSRPTPLSRDRTAKRHLGTDTASYSIPCLSGHYALTAAALSPRHLHNTLSASRRVVEGGQHYNMKDKVMYHINSSSVHRGDPSSGFQDWAIVHVTFHGFEDLPLDYKS